MDSAASITVRVEEALRARFGDAILDAAEASRGDPSVTVRPDKVFAVAHALRDEHGFDLMSDATAIDGLKLGPRRRCAQGAQPDSAVGRRRMDGTRGLRSARRALRGTP